MKNLILILFLFTIVGSAIAKKDKKLNEPFIGSWKFTKKSTVNEFQKVFENKLQSNYETEYFIFEPNHTFKHDFIDKAGTLIKSLTGKWYSEGDKIKITYSNIDFNLSLNYFFLDKDLVLGQNFSHVIFTKDNTDFQNLVLK